MIRRLLSTLSVTALCASLVGPVLAQSVSGAYLAGRHAAMRSDYAAAAEYYSEALARDPENTGMMESSALANLSLGDVARAIPAAASLQAAGIDTQVVQLLMSADRSAKGAYGALLENQSAESGIGLYVDQLVKAWAHLGAGDVAASMAAFDAMAQQPGLGGFVYFHKALALATSGDFAASEALFETGQAGAAGNTRRGILARAEILSQMDRSEDAIALIDTSFKGATDPEIDALLTQLRDKKKAPLSVAPTVKAGLAEVYFTFSAVLLSEQAGDHYVLLFSRIARYLRPEHIDALLMTADLLENLAQYDLAIAELKDVPANNPAFHAAELVRANIMRRADRPEEAIEVLQQLTQSHGNLAVVHSTMGDLLRGQEDFEGAILAYDRALPLIPEENASRWLIYYSRGIAEERSGDWESSERDFRSALEINPEQPQVLNYLGYSMVEQNRNLDEAMEMIERAVAASPDSGYIIDSLGWVLYQVGRYEEAVVQMEKAVQIEAVDPVVNDHLGDVYWAVGRFREAEFQWSRALSFIDFGESSTEAEPDRIRRKLEIGLDAVLVEEGAPPLKSGDDI